MKFLLKDDVIIIKVAGFAVVLKIFLHHFIRYITSTPHTIANCPKMLSPVPFVQFWKLFLKTARATTFQPLNKIAYRKGGPIFYMNMNMIFANYTFKDSNIIRITDLLHQLTTPHLNISLQNLIAILSNPYDMRRKPRNRMATYSLFFTHNLKVAFV